MTVETVEEADELTRNSEKESAIGKCVVTTPKLHGLSFTNNCLLLRGFLSSWHVGFEGLCFLLFSKAI